MVLQRKMWHRYLLDQDVVGQYLMRVFHQSQGESDANLEEAELEEEVHQQTSIPIQTNI
jgi:hypothetical protein